jgi:hypothetical protein
MAHHHPVLIQATPGTPLKEHPSQGSPLCHQVKTSRGQVTQAVKQQQQGQILTGQQRQQPGGILPHHHPMSQALHLLLLLHLRCSRRAVARGLTMKSSWQSLAEGCDRSQHRGEMRVAGSKRTVREL